MRVRLSGLRIGIWSCVFVLALLSAFYGMAIVAALIVALEIYGVQRDRRRS